MITYISIIKIQIDISEEYLVSDSIPDIEKIVSDIRNWIPLFSFPNGDAFCLDRRNNKIVFYEHEVFDTGINLHGLVIANNIEELIIKWSKVLFIDIYDWYEGVDDDGIDLSREIYIRIC